MKTINSHNIRIKAFGALKYTSLVILLTALQFSDLLGQTQREENLWEEVLGAADKNAELEFLKEYISVFCEQEGQGAYCDKANYLLKQLKEFQTYAVKDKCAGLNNLEEKADCIKARLIEFPNNNKLQVELDAIEEELWASISKNSKEWNLTDFESFLNVFEKSKYSANAADIVEFLDLGNLLEPIVFFNKHVDGKGKDKLHYFETLYEGEGIAEIAKKQTAELEEIVWLSDSGQNTEVAYRHYLKFYPNGKYFDEAKKGLSLLANSQIAISKTADDERIWNDIISTSSDPQLVREYINKYSNSSFIIAAKELYAKLDTETWNRSKIISSETAYRNYIDLFPDGGYVEEAIEILPRLLNDAEDLLWKSAVASGETGTYEDFLDQYPSSKYRTEAKLKLSKILESEYNIIKKGALYEIGIINASNIRIVEQSSDSIVVKVVDKAKNLIEAAIIHSGRHYFKVTDENNKNITIYLSDIISIDVFEVAKDSLIVLVDGGQKPYLVLFQDTILSERRKPLSRVFESELISLSKNEIIELMDAGVYSVLIRDGQRRNTAIAGVIDLSQPFEQIVKRTLSYLGVFLGLLFFWYVLQRKIVKKKTIYDQVNNDDEWD